MKPHHLHLSRRERQIMDVLYARGGGAVADVMERLPDPPTYSAVRAALATLEAKGYVRHEKEGSRFVFIPTTSASAARKSAVRHLLDTFFQGSRENAVAALLDVSPLEFAPEELDRLAALIESAKKGVKR